MIYWSDITEKKIYKWANREWYTGERNVKFRSYVIIIIDYGCRAPIDEGNERTVVVNEDVTSADGLAVDWIYNHIYWADASKNSIELSNFEGNMRKTLIKGSIDLPRAIALNPLQG